MTQLKFPPQLRVLRFAEKPTGAVEFRHPCSFCGGESCFGHGVFLSKFWAVYYDKEGNKTGKRDDSLLGIWTCGIDKCLVTGEIPNAVRV